MNCICVRRPIELILVLDKNPLFVLKICFGRPPALKNYVNSLTLIIAVTLRQTHADFTSINRLTQSPQQEKLKTKKNKQITRSISGGFYSINLP